MLCVAALLLAAGSSAADANAAAAAAAAAATPDTPQTSDKVASAQPASSVRVSEQTQREKVASSPDALVTCFAARLRTLSACLRNDMLCACGSFHRQDSLWRAAPAMRAAVWLLTKEFAEPAKLLLLLQAVGGSKAAASGAASKKAASPSPAPAAAAKEAGAGPAAPPVSGQAPPNFPGTVVATPVTPASPNDVQAATVFPGGITVPVSCCLSLGAQFFVRACINPLPALPCRVSRMRSSRFTDVRM